jgi:hypothetical protein
VFRHLVSEYEASLAALKHQDVDQEKEDAPRSLRKSLTAHIVGFYMFGEQILPGLLGDLVSDSTAKQRRNILELARQMMEQVGDPEERAAVIRRGATYFEVRLAALRAAKGAGASIEDFQSEFEGFCYWLELDGLEVMWRAQMLLTLLELGIVPSDGWVAVEWLSKHVEEIGVSIAVRSLDLLLISDRSDRWLAASRKDEVRATIRKTLRDGSPADQAVARALVNKLEARNQAGFLDLLEEPKA